MKLVITDLDGTLLQRSGTVHDDDVRAARALKAHGVGVSIATGRLYSGTRPTCRTLGLDGPVGCADGSQLVHAADDRALETHALPDESVRWMLEVDATKFVFANDRVHHDARGAGMLPYVTTWSRELVEHADLGEVPGPAKMLLLVGAPEPVSAARARAVREGLAALCFPFREELAMVVRRGGIDKGTAIEFIARQHGVALEDVAVVGDWLNDLPMLRRAGHRFVMAHATDEVKRLGQHEVPDRPLRHIARHFGISV